LSDSFNNNNNNNNNKIDYCVRNDKVTAQALQEILGKELLRRWVFKRFMKTDIDDADLTFSVFHSRTAATGKARVLMVERRMRGTTSDDVDAERRR